MAQPPDAPELRPVPGTARGRGRVIADLNDLLPRPTQRRVGVFRRALRREVSRLHDRRRILAILLLSFVFSLTVAALIARGDAAGADARAYWAGVRLWINGGDPYHPTGPFLPYVYAPWMLPLFAPWSVLPWDVAWFVWRGATILLLLWTIHWAYRRRPLTTAVIVLVLGFPFGANLDTGNINLQLTLMLWGAQFTGPRLGGLLWALATWMKWIPAVFWLILAPMTKRWGLIWLALSIALSLVLLPLTILQFQALFGFGARPVRLDYLVFLWAFVPWLYRRAGTRIWPVSPRGRRSPGKRSMARVDRFGSSAYCRARPPARSQPAGSSTGPLMTSATSSRRRASTGRSRNAEMTKKTAPTRTAARGPAPVSSTPPTMSMSGPPMIRAKAPADAVATLLMPMYRPDDALGMMSVMSAQSTARKAPAPTATSRIPTSAA